MNVLECTSCGAPLALSIASDDEAVTCSHCGASRKLPKSYRTLRQTRRSEEGLRRHAEQVLTTLDRPPHSVTRVLAAAFDQPPAVIWFWWSIPLLLTSILGGLKLANILALRCGYTSEDDVPFAFVLLMIATLLFLMVFLPRALGIFANRRATARERLLAAMMAHPPKIHGGPAECRNCGAPLDVPDDALIVRCPYCTCENVVRLRRAVVRAIGVAVISAARTVDECVALDRLQRADVRRKLWRELATYFVAIFGFFGLWAIGETSRERAEALGESPDLHTAIMVGNSLLVIVGAIIAVARTNSARCEREARITDDDTLAFVRILSGFAMPFVYFLGLRFLAWVLP